MNWNDFIEYLPYAIVDSLVYVLAWGAIILALKHIPLSGVRSRKTLVDKEVSAEDIEQLKQELRLLRESIVQTKNSKDESSPSLQIV